MCDEQKLRILERLNADGMGLMEGISVKDTQLGTTVKYSTKLWGCSKLKGRGQGAEKSDHQNNCFRYDIWSSQARGGHLAQPLAKHQVAETPASKLKPGASII